MPSRRRSDEDFRAEIDAHVALEADRLEAEGFPCDAARREAFRRFGSVALAAECFHESRRVMVVDHLLQDIPDAVRSLWKRNFLRPSQS